LPPPNAWSLLRVAILSAWRVVVVVEDRCIVKPCVILLTFVTQNWRGNEWDV